LSWRGVTSLPKNLERALEELKKEAENRGKARETLGNAWKSMEMLGKA
jgi:hypothetical protein